MSDVLEKDFPVFGFDRPAAGVLRLTLDTGRENNVIDADQHEQMANVWPAIARLDDVRAVVVRGSGNSLCAGGDLNFMLPLVDDPDAQAECGHAMRDLVWNIVDFPWPIITCVTGMSSGGGMALALMADVSIAAESAQLIDAHTLAGLATGDHAALLWPLACGLPKAKWLLLSATPVSGVEAERIGLVSLCVPDADVESRALEVASTLAGRAPEAIRGTKKVLNLWLHHFAPIFEASAALEVSGFGGSAVRSLLAGVPKSEGRR
jgi:enoyl-CoA hydratase